jgi:hypothetical protein
MVMFEVEDEVHAESQGVFPTFDAAMAELKRRASIPWDCDPNRAPCISWRTCGRRYEIIEYNDHEPAVALRRILALEVRASGVTWHI